MTTESPPQVFAGHQAPDMHRPALVDGARTVSHGELHARANQTARFLLARGVGAGDTVGLLMGRSIEFAMAALAVRKSGAAYLPLDPSYPRARLEFMIEDAKPNFLLTAGEPDPALGPPGRSSSVDSEQIAAQDAGDVFSAPLAEQTAYVIYTSGTTGAPKGVCISHGNLASLVAWHREAFSVTAQDRAVLLSPVGFDASVWELWPYLASGATLLLPAEELKRQPEALRDWLVGQRITLAFVPTPLAEHLVRLPWPKETSLRAMLTGGDTLRRYPPPGLPFRLVNNYGPAECTVVSTSGDVPASTAPSPLPSIGRPISGVRITLLDQNLEEVPAGGAGEICIGGPGLGQGYLNRPELTAQKFIQRQTAGGGEHVYRSGDLGRLHPDGSLQFLGRIDEQVKIRGYRIECGEVEATLNSLPGVAESAVAALEEDGGERRLVAWLVAAAGSRLSRRQLRQELLNRLPAYMVPGEFVLLAAVPLTEHGKVDRHCLPRPTPENRLDNLLPPTESAASYLEDELMTILKDQLGIQQIARDDNFFLLGGHSFAAAQVIARIRSRFHVELSLRTVFDHPTPAAMAQQIEQHILAKLQL